MGFGSLGIGRRFCGLFVFSFFLVYRLEAERLEPEQVQLSTPAYQVESGLFQPQLGTYHYSVNWQGIPAASATTTITREGDYYRVVASARTAKAIDLFFRLRYFSEGLISSTSFTPTRTVINHRENSRHRNIEIQFLEGGEILTTRRSNKDFEVVRFNPENFTLDPFAAAMLARALNWEVGETKIFDTYNGRSRYLISLTNQEQTTLRINGKDQLVWVITPKVDKVTDPKANSKLNHAKIFVTADERRDIVRIQSDVFIGSVRTELEKFEPLAITAKEKPLQTVL